MPRAVLCNPANPIIEEADRWAGYVAGVWRQFCSRHRQTPGLTITIDAQIPIGAGLSSSAALEVAVALAIDHILELRLPSIELARLCRAAEEETIGVQCGMMDQLAALLGKEGQALLPDCRSFHYRYLPLQHQGLIWVLTDSGIRHELSCNAYNLRRRECQQALQKLQTLWPNLTTLRDLPEEAEKILQEKSQEIVMRRARHVFYENRRVLRFADLLAKEELPAAGGLLFASHESLRTDFEVSCETLDRIVEAARQTHGCLGSRMIGGGFGGCVLTLLTDSSLPRFLELTSQISPHPFPPIRSLVCTWGKGAEIIKPFGTKEIPTKT